MADESPEPTRDLMLTPLTRVQFVPIGSDLYMVTIDGTPVGDMHLNEESREWLAGLPTAEQYGEQLDQMRVFFQQQGVTL